MPKVVFTHAVTDPAHWASKHAERVAAFASWGTNVVDYVSPDGGKTVAVGVDVHDMAAMQAALTSPEIADLLEIPLGSVASRLRRAREQFRSEAERIENSLRKEDKP